MAENYFTASIPDPVQILGLALRPFSLGHFFLMKRFEVAFASEEFRDATIQDLILAVLICSRTYDQFLELIETNDFHQQVRAWGEKIGIHFSLPEKVRLFNAYLAEAFKQPAIVYEVQTTSSGAHWAHVLRHSLISQCGYTASQAMDLPLAQAFADFYKNAETNGILSIADDQLAAALNYEDDSEQSAISFVPPVFNLPGGPS